LHQNLSSIELFIGALPSSRSLAENDLLLFEVPGFCVIPKSRVNRLFYRYSLSLESFFSATETRNNSTEIIRVQFNVDLSVGLMRIHISALFLPDLFEVTFLFGYNR
jgi:hypothetical protein